MDTNLTWLVSVCKVKSRRRSKRAGLLVVVVAAVTVLALDITQDSLQWHHLSLSNNYNASWNSVLHYASPFNNTTQGDGSGDTQNVNRKKLGELRDFDAAVDSKPDGGFLLPTRPRAEHQKLYQKDSIQQLNNTWTEKMRAAWVSLLKERQTKLQEMCHHTNMSGSLVSNSHHVLGHNLVWVTPHRFVWCPIFKAASTTWVKNLLLAAGKPVENKSLHAQVRQLYPPPATAKDKKKTLKNSMKMIVVRHPFERLLSAYRDKMLRVVNRDDPYITKQQMIARSYLDEGGEPTPYTAAELKKVSSHSLNITSLVHPTFTQFLKRVQDDAKQIWKNSRVKINLHWRPYWITCDPCRIEYDIIAHVETLVEDQEFVIRELGFQDLLRPAHTHASRFDGYNDTSEAAKTYFSQVPLSLLQSLAKLYRPDFELFGYSPDKYLVLAAHTP